MEPKYFVGTDRYVSAAPAEYCLSEYQKLTLILSLFFWFFHQIRCFQLTFATFILHYFLGEDLVWLPSAETNIKHWCIWNVYHTLWNINMFFKSKLGTEKSIVLVLVLLEFLKHRHTFKDNTSIFKPRLYSFIFWNLWYKITRYE